eukprot:jgi/Orpsp1_1/1185750/evm.model.c7180000095054.1
MIKENSDKGKCKNVTDALVKHANHLPLNLRKIKNTEDGIQKIQEGILSLTTRPPKIIKKKDLALLYNFNPAAVADLTIANDEDIHRIEKACFNRISEIIERKESPTYIKDFFRNELNNIKFTKFTIPISTNATSTSETITASELTVKILLKPLLIPSSSVSKPRNAESNLKSSSQ